MKANTIDVVEAVTHAYFESEVDATRAKRDLAPIEDIVTATLEAIRSAGYVVVPVEPTDAMVKAGAYGSSVGVAAGVWVAMIAAAEGGE